MCAIFVLSNALLTRSRHSTYPLLCNVLFVCVSAKMRLTRDLMVLVEVERVPLLDLADAVDLDLALLRVLLERGQLLRDVERRVRRAHGRGRRRRGAGSQGQARVRVVAHLRQITVWYNAL